MRIFVTTARFYGRLAEAPAKEGLQSTGAFGSVGNRPGNEKRDRFVPQRPHGRSLVERKQEGLGTFSIFLENIDKNQGEQSRAG